MYKPNKPTLISLVSHDPDQWDNIIFNLDGLKFWAYIYHDKDTYDNGDHKVVDGMAAVGDPKPKHLHVVALDSPKNFKSWANRFGVPENLIEWKANRKATLLYLTHESANSLGKHRYDRKEVITSDPVRYQTYISAGDIPDYKAEYNDLLDLQKGKITVSQYLDRHQDLLAVSSYQRLNIYSTLFKLSGSGN